MRIVRVDVVEVVVPARDGSINSPERDLPLHKLADGLTDAWTRQFDTVPKHVLIARCDDGTLGYGEALRAARPDVLAAMARTLIGADPTALAWQDLPFPRVREYDAVEVLVLDLVGKAWGVPVSTVVGGALRDRVPVGAWSGHRTPADAARLAADAAAAGFTTLKLKCDRDDDLGAIARAVADRAGPDLRLILDPNERLDEFRHALAACRSLERVGNVLCLEDPLPRTDLGAYRRLRDRTDVPVAVHVALGYTEHGQRAHDVVAAATAGAADVLNLSAGVADFLRMGHAADLHGLPYWHGSEIDLGILEAAYVHAAAAARGCTLPSDVFGRAIREHDLLVEPLRIASGHAEVPRGPGLGVDLDPEAVDRYATGRTTVE